MVLKTGQCLSLTPSPVKTAIHVPKLDRAQNIFPSHPDVHPTQRKRDKVSKKKAGRRIGKDGKRKGLEDGSFPLLL